MLFYPAVHPNLYTLRSTQVAYSRAVPKLRNTIALCILRRRIGDASTLVKVVGFARAGTILVSVGDKLIGRVGSFDNKAFDHASELVATGGGAEVFGAAGELALSRGEEDFDFNRAGVGGWSGCSRGSKRCE